MSGKRSTPVTGRASAIASIIDLARTQLREGRPAEAEPTARRAIALDRKSVDARLLLAESQQRTGRRNDAVLTLREALDLEPNNAFALVRLGIVLRETKRLAEAEAVAEAATRHRASQTIRTERRTDWRASARSAEVLVSGHPVPAVRQGSRLQASAA